MAPLTLPSGCESCTCLSKRIAELEKRISTLYQIQDGERFLDTIIFGPAQATNTSGELEATAPYRPPADAPPPAPLTAAAAAAAPATAPRACTPTAAAPDDLRLQPGARPKALATSTPSHAEPWTTVARRQKTGSRSPPPAPAGVAHGIHLENQFDILNLRDFPLLSGNSRPSPPSSTPCRSPPPQAPPRCAPKQLSRRASRRSMPNFTPAPWKASARSLDQSPPSPQTGSPKPSQVTDHLLSSSCTSSTHHVSSQRPSPRPLFPPTTVIIGDSIVRHVRFFNAVTHCLPGATVRVILGKLPGLLQSLPPSVTQVVVHVGSNDSTRLASELIKTDFKDLFMFLKNCGKSVFLSGPTPTFGRGGERFSRLLSLHTWLQSTCTAYGFCFIDNFNLFWNRPSFYRLDGLHPSKLGSRILAANFQYTLHTCQQAHA